MPCSDSDQVSELPGDVVGPRHRADQQIGILEVGQIAADDVVRRADTTV